MKRERLELIVTGRNLMNLPRESPGYPPKNNLRKLSNWAKEAKFYIVNILEQTHTAIDIISSNASVRNYDFSHMNIFIFCKISEFNDYYKKFMECKKSYEGYGITVSKCNEYFLSLYNTYRRIITYNEASGECLGFQLNDNSKRAVNMLFKMIKSIKDGHMCRDFNEADNVELDEVIRMLFYDRDMYRFRECYRSLKDQYNLFQ